MAQAFQFSHVVDLGEDEEEAQVGGEVVQVMDVVDRHFDLLVRFEGTELFRMITSFPGV